MSATGPLPEDGAVRLPEAVRQRVVETAAQRLGSLEEQAVPASLRRIARFTPARRARLGALPIAVALERHPEFREAVADAVREALPDLAAALEAGAPLPTVAVEEVASAAYLLRPPDWQRYVEAATAAPVDGGPDAGAQSLAGRLRSQLETMRAERRAEQERWRTELQVTRAEMVELRRRLGEARDRARRAEAEAEDARSAAEQDRSAAVATVSAAEVELRRVKTRLAEVEAALDAARRTQREARGEGDVRLRLLLDTLVDAAAGLRRDLALPPTTARPADAVADGAVAAPAGQPAARGLDAGDPAVLEELLALPRVHLVVDGYNVTKSGYGQLPLADQRVRLTSALAAVAARTGAEVTVVFDGADVPGVRSSAPRGVRVIFTPAGQIADDWIRRLVAAEPAGRVVVVVSSDREVADGVRRSGARSVPAVTLVRLLDRG